MAAIFLSEADVASLVDMPFAIEAVEEAFAQWAAGKASNVPRARAISPGIVLHTMSAAAEYLGLVGWKCYTTTKQGAKFYLALYDAGSGAMLALIEADRVGQLRTGAVSGVAAKFLADPAADTVGLFGTGLQARTQLEALAAVRPLRRATVYSRDQQRRQSFAREMSAKLQIEVFAADNPRQAVEGLPIVVTATTSRAPVFDGNWLRPDALVCAMGSNWLNKAEIDVTTIRRAAMIVCDSIAACQIEAGDFVEALAAGDFAWSQAIELADVVGGRARQGVGCITIFKSVGLAIEDVALGARVLQLARERGVGAALPW